MNKRLLLLIILSIVIKKSHSQFVQQRSGQFLLNERPYYYIGANYWYGAFLGLEKNKTKGIARLRKELDFLKGEGITNLRLLAAVEGNGTINGVQRVQPALQKFQGKFDINFLKGLDILLDEMGKRNMKAVLYLSNNWEWSGGFLQYVNWNGLLPDSIMKRKLNWNEYRDYVSNFYSCNACKEAYNKQLDIILNRTNSVSNKKYKDDPSIMAWELANEPRPMRSSANENYKQWISSAAAYIKLKDKNHLVTTGVEGEMGTESLQLFEEIHADKNIDYATIHIWPKNWSWFKPATMKEDFVQVVSKTQDYINKHIAVAEKIHKPLVIEEFGLPRDNHSFEITAATDLRNNYFNTVFQNWKTSAENNGVLAGLNFWAFNGSARPINGQTFWKEGDDYMGDPPMEEQGLNGVFDSDTSTWNLIWNYSTSVQTKKINTLPSDKNATKETLNLYNNLKKLLNKGVMFGHQDDLAYGVGWKYENGRSDVKDVAGDYPALYGWELGNIEHELPYNLDSVPFDKMKVFIQQGYERGGVITIGWHGDNPVNEGSAWDTTHAVQSVLPGGSKHELYKTWLDKVAKFLTNLKGKKGEAIPILFRPYHELTGNWFWWGKNTCTPNEFKLLWRFTIDYLRNEKAVHNLLLVYNTASLTTKEDFLERYPGDDVVDIVSFDSYQSGDPGKNNSFVENLGKRFSILEEIAKEKNKIPAFAETGYEAIPYPEWWTNTLWKAIGDHKISYVLLWRNNGALPNGHMHYYAPYKGHPSAKNFMDFYKLDKTLFEKDVAKEKLYK